MNKQEIEKRIIKHFTNHLQSDVLNLDIKNFIFNEILPEVLKSVLPAKYKLVSNDPSEKSYKQGLDDVKVEIKQKAKELYNINL